MKDDDDNEVEHPLVDWQRILATQPHHVRYTEDEDGNRISPLTILIVSPEHIDRLVKMDIFKLGTLAGCAIAEDMSLASGKIARYCALVAVGAIELPEQ